MTKRIGVLTSGGDCAGLNAVIRGVVRRAEGYGWSVVGIRQGTAGLLARPIQADVLHSDIFDGVLMRRGGTMLGTTNKDNPFTYPAKEGGTVDRSDEVVAAYRDLGLDALIGIGGDGSMKILRALARKGGWNLIGIPKTIDNDVGCTEISVGHPSAVDVATGALDHLQPTAASHDRVMVLEVMGRDAGHIALTAGIAGGADVILIPEIPYRLDGVARAIENLRRHGRSFALVVVAESIQTAAGQHVYQEHPGGGVGYGGVGHYIGNEIGRATGAEVRVTTLGHVQRGGMPIAQDRIMASVFGVHAVDMIAEGRFDRMVAWQNRQAVDVPIAEAIERFQAVDPNGALVRTARGLGISFGDDG